VAHQPLRITYETKPGIVEEKRGSAALLLNNSRFCFIFNPKDAALLLNNSRFYFIFKRQSSRTRLNEKG